jgi:hypothetical protein
MKKYILMMSIVLSVISCEDYLDMKSNEALHTEEVIFNNFQSARGYFDKVFDMLDDYLQENNQGMGGIFITGEMSDEVCNIWNVKTNMGKFLNRGVWDTQNFYAEIGWEVDNANMTMVNVIPKSFSGMRICNRILAKIPELEGFTQEQKDQLMGQAYMLRAWFFFEVIRRIGGFIILDRIYDSDESGNMERKTYAECTDWIIEDNLDHAIQLLPHKWEASQTGRPTKSSAYALKSMVMLYAASPLMRNGFDRTDQYNDYDPDRVKLAAEYAWNCLKYLEDNQSVYDQLMMPGVGNVPGTTATLYSRIFYYPPQSFYMSKESLWYKNNWGRTRDVDITRYWQTWFMANRPGDIGCGQVNPTQNIMNKFETINGYKCELTETGWVCADSNWDINVPFKKRDPRLEYQIILPGEHFGTSNTDNMSTAQISAAGLTVADFPDNRAYYICTWETGRETDTKEQSVEGGRADVLGRFLIKKYQWPGSVRGTSAAGNYNENTFSTPFIRTTQVWLDYAEAMNEAYGPTAIPAGFTYSAVQAVNMVRGRVGQCEVRPEYIGSKETFREKIRDERAIELLCENHRWFDIRRWMIAEQLFANDPNPIKGARITIKSGYSTYNTWSLPPGATQVERLEAKYGACFNYVRVPITEEMRIFERKHYWYPLRKDEVSRYPALKQNPGW